MEAVVSQSEEIFSSNSKRTRHLSVFEIAPECVFWRKGIGAEKTNAYKAKKKWKDLGVRPTESRWEFCILQMDILFGDAVNMLEKCTTVRNWFKRFKGECEVKWTRSARTKTLANVYAKRKRASAFQLLVTFIFTCFVLNVNTKMSLRYIA